MALNLTCIPGGFNPSPIPTNTCACASAYYGLRCESVLSWWFPLNTFNHVFEGLILLGVLFWAGVVIVAKVRRYRLGTLTGIASIIQVVAIVSRLIFLCLPGGELVPYSTNLAIGTVTGVVLSLSIVLWIMAMMLITAFWYELWTSRAKADGTIARGSKILLIVSALIFFVCAVVGLIYLRLVASLGFLIYYIPLGIIIAFLFGFTVRIGCFKTKTFTSNLKAKHQWTVRLLAAAVVNWIIYYITLGLYADDNPLSMLGLISFRLTEAVAAIINMALIDYRGRTFVGTLSGAKVKDSTEPQSATPAPTGTSNGSSTSTSPSPESDDADTSD